MTRFFVTPEEMMPEFLVLTGENAQHAKVLRLKEGEEVLYVTARAGSVFAPSVMSAPDKLALW